MNLLRYSSACTLVAAFLTLSSFGAQADDFRSFSFLPGDDGGAVRGLSGDGLTVIGSSNLGLSRMEAFRWTANDGIEGLGFLAGDMSSVATGASADGSVIVGTSYSGFLVGNKAFLWTQAGGMVGLGTLVGGAGSTASGVSADGLVVVGQSGSLAHGQGEAFRWTAVTGMVGLGVLPGTLSSRANATNADGSVVVGAGEVDHGGFVYTSTAIRWTQAGGMVDLGTLAGFTETEAYAVSADGSTVVGEANSGLFTASEAFIWTQSGGMMGLGRVGGIHSSARAISADGSVVVGSSTTSNNTLGEAFRWTAASGMKSLADLLAEGGVNLGSNILYSATGVSADGRVIAGSGFGSNNWIAICNSALCTGLVTPENIAASFSNVGAVAQTTNAYVGGQLASLTDVATQHKEGPTPLSVFGSGFYDSDPVGAANIGATFDLGGGLVIGGTLGESLVETPMLYDGSSRVWGTSLGAFIASNPDQGFQWLVGANASYLDGSIDRQYINGVSISESSGDVKGNGIGAVARVGYSFNAAERVRLTPFASFTLSRAHIDGYTENNGPVPAQFDDIDDTARTLRLGSDARYSFSADTWTWGTLAWAHRVDDAQTTDITGMLVSALPMTTPGVEVAENWAEATAGVRLPLSERASFTASVTAVIPDGYSTTFQARLGVAYAF